MDAAPVAYRLVPASPLHVGPLVSRLGAATKLLMMGDQPRDQLRKCMRQSAECWTAIVDDKPVAMWGLFAPTLGTEGYVWLCVTEDARRFPVSIVREARAHLRRVFETLHCLTGIVSPEDSRAIRFARFLGFDVANEGARLPNGAAVLPIRMTRVRPQTHPPFIILALPRSRTAWLSAFLSYGEWTCHHEIAMTMRGLADVRAFFQRPNTGAAETGAILGWDLIRHNVPDIRTVVIHRPPDDAADAMLSAGKAADVTYDEAHLRLGMRRGARALEKISAAPGVLSLGYGDLGREDACSAIFEHCLPYAFDCAWWREMRERNVQADVGAVIRYYLDNLEAINEFKRQCKSELRALVLGGILGRRAMA